MEKQKMINELSKNIHFEIVKKINDNTLQLASLPDIIIKVNRVLADENKGMADIAKVVQNEIALSVRIIHVANSPALRGEREITSINDAITRLGIVLVKNLALCVTLKDKFDTKNMINKHIMEEEIHVSMQRSVIGFMIAKHLVDKLKPEMALIAGLVSKIGHIVVLRYMNDIPEYKVIPESEVIQIINTIGDDIGDVLLRRWDFPISIINSIFSRELTMVENQLESYTDVYKLSNKYLDYKQGKIATTELFGQIDTILEIHSDDVKSLEGMFF
jgi:HD-like signal output (HDOD) protein